MENSQPCKSCGKRSLVRDDVSSYLICSLCGSVQEFDSFEAHIGGISGPKGTYVRVGTAGTGSYLNYKDKKIYEAQNLIEELMSRLDLAGSRSMEVRNMISEITEGEFGQGNWFPVLIGACAYVIMRKDYKAMSIAEVASVVESDVHELGRMIGRVVSFLNLELPEFDVVSLFERTVRNLPSLIAVSSEKMQLMVKQGLFLIQCAIKWFLTTGRRPLPIVVAVLIFVAELNQVDIQMEEVATQVSAAVVTCKLRYKELLKALVEVAQALPWGKDITIKNMVKNAPFVIQYMEMKSISKPKEVRKDLELGGLDLDEVVSECLRKHSVYKADTNCKESESLYFEVGDNRKFSRSDTNVYEKLKLSHECLSLIYPNFINEFDCSRSMEESGKGNGRKMKRGFELSACSDWWMGKSELSKKLLLKQILDKDVGFDPMPPSFVTGCLTSKRRREKINAAKKRISKIMHPLNTEVDNDGDICPLESVHTGKKRKRRQFNHVDWEDFIIEMLLLHQVKEEEIEKGHYNTLLDLHVFNSGIM